MSNIYSLIIFLLKTILYIFTNAASLLISDVMLIFNAIVSVFDSGYGFAMTGLNYLTSLFDVMLPAAIVLILIAAFVIVVVLRLRIFLGGK